MKTAIEITESHIRNGTAKDTRSCPIALALKECLPDSAFVSVEDSLTEIRENPASATESNKWYTHSRGVEQWIEAFDRNKTAETTEIILDNKDQEIWIATELDFYKEMMDA